MNLTLIRNAELYDGTGKPHFKSDVLIENDKIVKIDPAISVSDAAIVDAQGLALSPGFIDAHAHSDLSILAAPEALGKISQGITSELSGNCGLSAFPVRTEEVRTHLNELYRIYGIDIAWNDFDTFAQAVAKRKPAINTGYLCGHNTLRANVFGYRNTPGDKTGWLAMRSLLHEMLEQGALGMSTGLLYIPGKFSTREELLTVAGALRDFDMPYATHLRSEGDELLESIDEALSIATSGSGRLHISHLKTALPRNWHKLDAVFAKLDSARQRGLRVTADRYPYTYGQTSLSVILPPPYDKMTDSAIKSALNADPKKVEVLIRDLDALKLPWEGVILCSSSVSGTESVFGLPMPEAASRRGQTSSEFCAELMALDAPGTMAAFGGLSPENLERILLDPYVSCGTDETARPLDYSLGRSHPRGFGSFPNFLRSGLKHLSLEEMIRKVTSLPASVFGLRNRGTISVGSYADLVLFSPSELWSRADFGYPHRLSEGIFSVYVNGVLSYKDGKILDCAGKILKKC